jgi:hypothetical protein
MIEMLIHTFPIGDDERAGRGEHPTLMEASEALRWPADSARGIGSARAAYLWLPEATLLWQAVGTYMPADPVEIRSLLLTGAASSGEVLSA